MWWKKLVLNKPGSVFKVSRKQVKDHDAIDQDIFFVLGDNVHMHRFYPHMFHMLNTSTGKWNVNIDRPGGIMHGAHQWF